LKVSELILNTVIIIDLIFSKHKGFSLFPAIKEVKYAFESLKIFTDFNILKFNE